MKSRALKVIALSGGLLFAAPGVAGHEGELRAATGDVFSSQGRPANATATTGTQSVQGNPNCPQPVINGIRPKNWSCRTGTQIPGRPAAPQRPWLDQFSFPSAAAQEPIPGRIEEFNSNGQGAKPAPTYPKPTYSGYVPTSVLPQKTRPAPAQRPEPRQPVSVDQLEGHGYIWWGGERLGYKVTLNANASGAQAVANVKLEGTDKKRYDQGKAVIVMLKGNRTSDNAFTTTGVWVKPLGKNSEHGKYFITNDVVTLKHVKVRVR